MRNRIASRWIGWTASSTVESKRNWNRRDWVGRSVDQASELGAATAEYAISTLAACGFAGLLLVILRSGEVRGLLLGIIRRALSVG